jgi:hypothetical protein
VTGAIDFVMPGRVGCGSMVVSLHVSDKQGSLLFESEDKPMQDDLRLCRFLVRRGGKPIYPPRTPFLSLDP